MDETTTRRLAFVKYVWRRADESCEQPEPLSAASVLSFHDAVELFLQICSEHVDAGSQQPTFMEYWDLIGKKLAEGLSHKESMRRLNKARVALKHHGTLPSSLDVQGFRAAVRGFFDENTPRVFGVSFERISISAFVQPSEARDYIEEAVRHLEDNNIEQSLEASACAFQRLLSNAEQIVANRWGISPFRRYDLNRFGRYGSFRNIDDPDGEFHRFAESVVKSVEELFDALRLISLGVDYHRLLRFRQATPNVMETMDGKLHVTWMRAFVSSPEITPALAQFCIDFVIDTALNFSSTSHIHQLFVGEELPDRKGGETA